MKYFKYKKLISAKEWQAFSDSMSQSIEDWDQYNLKCIDCERDSCDGCPEAIDAVILNNEVLTVIDDSSRDEWNGRHGYIVEAKFPQRSGFIMFSIHVTGGGFGWGTWEGLDGKKVELLVIPDEYAVPGRTVYDRIKASPDWVEFYNCILSELVQERDSGDVQNYGGLVPHPV